MRKDGSQGNQDFGGPAMTAPKPKKRWADSVEELASYRKQGPEVLTLPLRPARHQVDQFCETLDFLAGDLAAGSPAAPPPRCVEAAASRSPSEIRVSAAQRRREEWFDESRRNLPCWLTSMVLHLTLVIVLGSLTIPPATRQFVGTTLLLSFAQDETGETSRAAAPMSFEGARETGAGRSDSGPPKQLDAASQSEPARLTSDELSDPTFEIALASSAEHNLAAAAPEPQEQAIATTGPSQRGALASVPAARIPPPERLPASRDQAAPKTAADAEREWRLDDVVARFIEYDIGRLQGAEGERARREFDRLGPEAIPALVRGLNRSAKIHASCPVVVISNKLSRLTEHQHDRETLEYVVENLGKGVPRGAPHQSRLQSLKEQLLRELKGEPPPSSDEARLAQQLTSPQTEVRIAAARYIASHASEFGGEERASVAWPLIRHLSDRRLDVREAAHGALVALTEGKDFGPAEGKLASTKDVSAAASRWYDHFDHERYEAMAASVLASARHFEDARRRTSAIRYYRKLLEEYAGAKAADEAAKRLEELTGKAF
ncbi:MAG TPA: hypothetical protein VMV10_00840 [Pirellulales bacterium]|nr:hypothetical protein [Pirellulales bacterium]